MVHSSRAEYKGTWYNTRTSKEIKDILNDLNASQTRVRLHYGNTDTGEDWLEDYGTTGRIGRSTGQEPVPILVHNRRSVGGPGVMDHLIVRITETAGGKDLYRHPEYHVGTVKIDSVDYEIHNRKYVRALLVDGQPIRQFESETAADKWVQRMGLTEFVH